MWEDPHQTQSTVLHHTESTLDIAARKNRVQGTGRIRYGDQEERLQAQKD